MKWLGIALMVVGLIGGILLWEVPLPVSVQTTDYGGPHADIRQTELTPSAALPMFLLFLVGAALSLLFSKSTR
jgi:hypothetical protein